MFLFLERISIIEIIKNHRNTFYNNQTGKKSVREIVAILTICTLISLFLSYTCRCKNISEYILTAISIISGFLINALFILAEKKNKDSNDFQITKETVHNISFGIVLGFFIILLTGIFIIYDKSQAIRSITSQRDINHITIYVREALRFAYYFSICLFAHTLMVIIQRINYIFK